MIGKQQLHNVSPIARGKKIIHHPNQTGLRGRFGAAVQTVKSSSSEKKEQTNEEEDLGLQPS